MPQNCRSPAGSGAVGPGRKCSSGSSAGSGERHDGGGSTGSPGVLAPPSNRKLRGRGRDCGGDVGAGEGSGVVGGLGGVAGRPLPSTGGPSAGGPSVGEPSVGDTSAVEDSAEGWAVGAPVAGSPGVTPGPGGVGPRSGSSVTSFQCAMMSANWASTSLSDMVSGSPAR